MARKNRTPEENARREKIRELLQMANIGSMDDIQNLFKETIAEFMENGLEAELDDELGYSKYDYKNKDTDNSRNGHSSKTLRTSFGDVEVSVPRDRKGEFEPQVLKKNQTSISQDIEEKILSMYAKGMTTSDTGTEIRREDIDRFILGYQTDDFDVTEAIDRTVIHLPGSDNLVLVYNKHQEEERLNVKERALREDNYVIKPLASIPELDLEIYSRCIVCRMNAVGGFESLGEGDSEIWDRYLAY